jgi:hypothetical protein
MSSHERLEDWRHCWRVGFAPQFSDAGLEALRLALTDDDPKLIQNGTTMPRGYVLDWPAEAACPVGYTGWMGDGLQTVGEVENYFGTLCEKAGRRLGGAAGAAQMLNWIDDTPRDEMRRELLPEVERELARRVAPGGRQHE